MNQETSNQLNTVSLGKLFLVFLQFFSIVLFYVSLQTSSYLETKKEKDTELAMVHELDYLLANTSEWNYIWNRFNKIIESVKGKSFENLQTEKDIIDTYKNYKIKAKYFFYKNNEFIKGFNYNNDDLVLFKDILKQLHYPTNTEEFKEADIKTRIKLIDNLGPNSKLTLLKNNKNIVKLIKSNNTKQYYYWNIFPDGLGVFFVTTEIPDYIERFKILRNKDFLFNFGAIDSDNNIVISPNNITPDQTLEAYIKTQKNNRALIESNNFYWYFQKTKESNKICYTLPFDSINNSFFNWAEYIKNISIILFFMSMIIYIASIFKISFSKKIIDFVDNFSIRNKINGIYFITSFFPVIIVFIIGFSLLSDKENQIKESILSESLVGISKLEQQFNDLKNNSYLLAKELRELAKSEDITPELYKKTFDKYSINSDLSSINIKYNNSLLIVNSNNKIYDDKEYFIEAISYISLKLHDPIKLDKVNFNKAVFGEDFMSADEYGIPTLLQQRNKIWEGKMGSAPEFWYWDVFPELATGPLFFSFNIKMYSAYPYHLQNYLKNSNPSSDSLQLYATISEDGFCPEISTHSNIIFSKKELINICSNAIKTNSTLFRTVDINGKPYWITAKIDKNIQNHVFMHLINQEERLKSLEPFKLQIIVSSIVTLIILILGVFFITKLFILPINNLSQGIQAIRERNKDFIIPISRNDEFDELATAFNKVISEFKELEYGKIIQESLLPSCEPKIEGYDIAYFTISARELAGDYHDNVILDDGKVSIILGDVSGHGISAALAMAMAKATFNYAKTQKAKFPEDFMDMANIMFNKELKPRKKLMTLISILLTPESGEVTFDNAGQAYPAYYTAKNQTTEEIQIPSFTLGGIKKRKKKTITKTMEKGDAFILFTDGIIEALAANGEMFGYERFFAKFDEQMKQNISAKEAIKNIYQAMDNFREQGYRSDDVTMIIVKRN